MSELQRGVLDDLGPLALPVAAVLALGNTAVALHYAAGLPPATAVAISVAVVAGLAVVVRYVLPALLE